MMKYTQQFLSIGVGLVLLFVTVLVSGTPTAYAQCNPGETSGNLYGVAMTDEIGAIYMSTESWNDDPLGEGHDATTVEFYVSYDRQSNTWNGRGWNPYAGWVDFGGTNAANITARTAEFESVKQDPDSWGNWDPTIDLSPVSYEVDPGEFVGLATNGDYTGGGGGAGDDDYVGAGNIDFSGVELQTTVGSCDETVDVLLNGVNILYQESCPISAPTIQWTTNDITPNSCETGVGLWTGGSGSSRADSGSETASANITDSNTPVVFQLHCEGADSGTTVTGTAFASCGTDDPIDPTQGIIIPEFREV
ncbi:hypothetical protein KC866_01840 [Patescibacteria group bacterium]|nr:hypothetical protein [Patescibacteria group bacterium]